MEGVRAVRKVNYASGSAYSPNTGAYLHLRCFSPFLLRRETRLLRNLPPWKGVPRFLDSFESGEGSEFTCYLVQELVEGKTLADMSEYGSLGKLWKLEWRMAHVRSA